MICHGSVIINYGRKSLIVISIPIIVILSIFICIYMFVEEGVTVKLPGGTIKGRIITGDNDHIFYGFYQIYYAAAPTGPLRFKPPQKRKPWKGTMDTTRNTVWCYQNASYVNIVNLTSSEDCLYVNILTPVKPGQNSPLLPVYVFVHGGGFREGSAAQHDGMTFAKEGIVVVTVNYRLDVFGFLSAEDDVISGNMGLKDQRLAFEWVHDNIRYFNGNASQVTIGGQSAGSAAIGLHIIGNWSSDKVLFHRAIQQSSSPLWNYYNDGARMHAFELGRILNNKFKSNDSTDLLELLQAASADDIFQAKVSGHFAPILERSGQFSHKMLDSYIKGDIKDIQLLIGFTSEEKFATVRNDTFLAEIDSDPSLLLDSELLNIKNKTLVGSLIKSVYTNTTFLEDFPSFIRYYSDDTFVTPSLKQAELLSKFINVFVYQFSYKGELAGTTNIQNLEGCDNAPHNEELSYMWWSLDYIRNFSAADQLTSERVVHLWANFIKTGNPTPTCELLLENVSWPIFGSNDSSRTPYLNLNETLEIRDTRRNYRKIKEIYDENIQPPYIIYTNSDGHSANKMGYIRRKMK